MGLEQGEGKTECWAMWPRHNKSKENHWGHRRQRLSQVTTIFRSPGRNSLASAQRTRSREDSRESLVSPSIPTVKTADQSPLLHRIGSDYATVTFDLIGCGQDPQTGSANELV